MDKLTPTQAYLAMLAFLEAQYKATASDEIGGLLGSMALLPDGLPVDSAISADWMAAVEASWSGLVQAGQGLAK